MQCFQTYLRRSSRILRRILDQIVPYRKMRWLALVFLAAHAIFRIVMYDYLAILFFWALYILFLIVQYFTPSGMPDPDEDDTFLIGKKQTIQNNLMAQQLDYLNLDDNYGIDNQEQDKDQFIGPVEERPLLRTITEFTLWKNIMGTLLISWLCTLSDIFLIPVYWPFLLIYFLWLIGLAIHKHIRHMRKYGYTPVDFTVDKQKLNKYPQHHNREHSRN